MKREVGSGWMINVKWRSQGGETLPLGHFTPVNSFGHGDALGERWEMVRCSVLIVSHQSTDQIKKDSMMLEDVTRWAPHVQRGRVLALAVEMRRDETLDVCPAVQNTNRADCVAFRIIKLVCLLISVKVMFSSRLLFKKKKRLIVETLSLQLLTIFILHCKVNNFKWIHRYKQSTRFIFWDWFEIEIILNLKDI